MQISACCNSAKKEKEETTGNRKDKSHPKKDNHRELSGQRMVAQKMGYGDSRRDFDLSYTEVNKEYCTFLDFNGAILDLHKLV